LCNYSSPKHTAAAVLSSSAALKIPRQNGSMGRQKENDEKDASSTWPANQRPNGQKKFPTQSARRPARLNGLEDTRKFFE
jgi:hypothetical protein